MCWWAAGEYGVWLCVCGMARLRWLVPESSGPTPACRSMGSCGGRSIGGLAGLERWAGTPGTVGGALYGNAHFQGELIGDRVLTVGVVGSDGAIGRAAASEMEFGYDSSRLQRTGEVSLWAEFSVGEADPKVLRAAARESLTYRKTTQPLAARSAGCIFRNPDPAVDPIPEGVPASAGALIDRAGLKGCAVGRARVSALHGNFVVSDGTASPRRDTKTD